MTCTTLSLGEPADHERRPLPAHHSILALCGNRPAVPIAKTPLLDRYRRLALTTMRGMGVIRKTMSVATLGLVNWNSKSELLEKETRIRENLEKRMAALEESEELSRRKRRKAQKRAKKAELEQLALEKKVKRRVKAAELKGEAQGTAKTISRRARRKARKAAKKAEETGSTIAEKVSDAADAVTG